MGTYPHKDTPEDEKHTPKTHYPSHEEGGDDEINVEGLAGELADLQKSYTNRGDPSSFDFLKGDLTLDESYYDLDISSIIGSGIKAVHLRILVISSTANAILCFRKKGQTNAYNTGCTRPQVNFVPFEADIVCACDENGKIQYAGTGGVFSYIGILIRGWWF